MWERELEEEMLWNGMGNVTATQEKGNNSIIFTFIGR